MKDKRRRRDEKPVEKKVKSIVKEKLHRREKVEWREEMEEAK